jgi:hypothetical protein
MQKNIVSKQKMGYNNSNHYLKRRHRFMANVVSTLKFTINKRCKYSSSVMKIAISVVNGRSASIFRISTDYCINP